MLYFEHFSIIVRRVCNWSTTVSFSKPSLLYPMVEDKIVAEAVADDFSDQFVKNGL